MKMDKNSTLRISAIIFGLIALLHLLRLLFSWDIFIETREMPMWLSIVGLLVAGLLSWLNYLAIK